MYVYSEGVRGLRELVKYLSYWAFSDNGKYHALLSSEHVYLVRYLMINIFMHEF